MSENFARSFWIRNPRTIELSGEKKAEGLRVLMLSNAPVRVVGRNRYIVSDFHCTLLQREGIEYRIISE